MEYKFYHNKELNINAIDTKFNVKNPYDLYEKLLKCFSKETCAPRLRDLWSLDNKTKGQCSITAFLAQDIFAGDVYGILLSDGNYHCFNKVGSFVFDLTSEQFLGKKIDYNNAIIQKREDHFKKEEKYNRYLLLKNSLLKLNN